MGKESIETNRIFSREQAARHLHQVLEVDGPYNQTSFEAEIEEVPDSLTDLMIFFRTDSGEYATTPDPYSLFLARYNLENGTIPPHKFKHDQWQGLPCVRVRIAE
jgi:hypothetical protein